MILLGVDYGTVRVGLATLDTSVMIAFPLTTIPGGDAGEVAKAVLAVATKEGAERIVVGLPVPLDSEKGSAMMEHVAAFLEVLRALTILPVVTQNEQMTSAQVEKQRREMGLEKRHVDVDAAAAALMLEAYFERQKHVGGPSV